MQTESTESNAWQAVALAAMMRDAFRFHGGEKAGDLTLSAETAEVMMVGLTRLAELTRAAATTAV